jgi:two-component system LytT family response regulator
MIKTVIIDDEERARETLIIMLKMYAPEINVVAEADGVKSGIRTINEFNPALVFLDIQMGDGSGFDVLSNFPECKFKVIFVTAHEDYAIKAFRFSALDYLVKPVTPDDLEQAVKKIANSNNKEDLHYQLKVLDSNNLVSGQAFGKIILKTSDAIHIVEINDIIHCKAENNYTFIYLSDGNKLVVSRTLKEFDELLSEAGFLRVHQSHLVNLKQIGLFDKKDGGTIVMKDRSQIPVSFRKKDHLIQLIEKLGKQL